MPHMTKHDFAQLLSRARAAVETPGDLDADAVTHLIEDLASAEDLLTAQVVPWSIDIHVAEIDHRHGTNIYAALQREALMSEVAEFCRECWQEIDDSRDPATLGDEDVARIYFDLHPDEFLSTERISCPSAEMPSRS